MNKVKKFMTTRIFGAKSDFPLKGRGAGNGNYDFELPSNNRERVRHTSDEFQGQWLRALGTRQARNWIVTDPGRNSKSLKQRWKNAQASVEWALRTLQGVIPGKRAITEQEYGILDNARFLRGVLREVRDSVKSLAKLPRLQPTPRQTEIVVRAFQIGASFLTAVEFKFEEEAFSQYIGGIQRVAALEMRELWGLKPVLQFVLLEQLGAAAGLALLHI